MICCPAVPEWALLPRSAGGDQRAEDAGAWPGPPAGAGQLRGVVHGEGMTAVGAGGYGGGAVAAGEVLDTSGWAGRAGVPAVAPVHQGEQHRVKVLAFCGGAVVLAGRPFLVPLTDEDVLLDQPGQPGRQDLAGNPEIVGE